MLKILKIVLFFILLTSLTGRVYGQGVVKNIEFFGNEHIDDDLLETWSGIKVGLAVNQTLITTANQKIITGYQETGYLFARIDSTIIESDIDKKTSLIKWYINEGTLVRLGKVHMVADTLSIDDLENLVDFNEGDIYRREYIESELILIGQFYAENGYPLATIDIVNTSLRTEDDEKYIDIEIKINSGSEIEKMEKNTIRKRLIMFKNN